MTTPFHVGDRNSLALATTNDNDENVLPAIPKSVSSSLTIPKPLLNSTSPATDFQNLTIDTKASALSIGISSIDGHDKNNNNTIITTNSSSLLFIDKYTSLDAGSSDSTSIERTDSDQLEHMMAKFDDVKAGAFEDPVDSDTDSTASQASVTETPRALNRMMEKFDLLKVSSIDEPHQDLMMAKFDLLQNSRIDSPKMEDLNEDDYTEIYRDKNLFEVLSPNSQEGVEVQGDTQFASYSNSNSYSSNEMFADIEQFRSADTHENAAGTNAAAERIIYSKKHKIFEQRIVSLMNQVSSLELEKDELRSQKDELKSQLTVQHDQDVQDMYQNPYSDPFASSSQAAASNPFLKSASNSLKKDTVMGAASLSTVDNSELHRELTELRMKNQSLHNDLETSDRVKERLKKVLTMVQAEDKQKLVLLTSSTKEMNELKEREIILNSELDGCKVRLKGFEMAQKKPTEEDDNSAQADGKKSTRSENRKSFFSSSSSLTKTGDVATALVVSQKHNDALEAFNKELAMQITSLQWKCDALTERYGLKEPAAGDDKGKQLYSRYLEMKSSLSSLSVVLEGVQANNSELNERVVELETELSEQDQEIQKQNGDNTVAAVSSKSFDSESSSTSAQNTIITGDQEAALKALVEKLEVQIIDYREAEQLHGIVRAELESTVDVLEKEASTLRQQELEEPKTEKSIELNTELESLRDVMDAAAEKSTKLLNKMEEMLASSQEELQNERTKFKDLEAKYKGLLKITQAKERGNDDGCSNDHSDQSNGLNAEDDVGELSAELKKSERLLEENERLNAAILSLQKQTKQLNSELEQKTIKIEKSEKRVSTKHEQALQLTQANASLRDGIQKLKVHLSTISEQASKTEASLAIVKEELNSEHEKTQQLDIANSALLTKLDVLKGSIDGNIDEASSKKIELKSSLAASQKELSLERERVQKLLEAKKDLESMFDTTKEDLQTQLHTEKQKNLELDIDISALEQELYGSKLIIAAATRKMAEIDELKSMESTKLQEILESTKELLSAERAKVEGLNESKSSLESKLDTMKQNIEELWSSNATLKEEIEVVKHKAVTEATESSHQFSELEKLLATTQEELNEEEQQVEYLEKQVDDLTMQIQELEKCKSDLEVSLDDVKQEMLTINAKNADVESLLQSTKDDNVEDSTSKKSKTLGTEMGGGYGEKLEVTKKIKALLSHLQSTKTENAVLKTSLATLEDDKKYLEKNKERIAELETEKTALSVERNNVASTDVRLWEVEMLLGNTQRDLKDTIKSNEKLTGKVDNLESSIEKSQLTNVQTLKECETHVQINKEISEKNDSLFSELTTTNAAKQSLLKRTAALARRDQIQRASIMTSNDEVAKLMKIIADFQERFESLAEQVEKSEAEKNVQMKEYEYEEAKWISGKHDLTERITKLQTDCDEIRTKYNNVDSKHIQVLMKEQTNWQTERVGLNKRIAVLEKMDSEADSSESYQYPLKKCATDRSLLNQQISELEQDLQLMEVTMDGTKMDNHVTTAELESTKVKLSACEEELESCRTEMQSLVLKSVTDREVFSGKIIELEEEMESTMIAMEATKKERDSVSTDHEATNTILNACKEQLQNSRDQILDREKRIQEIEDKIEENECTIAEKELDIATALESAREDAKAAVERETELRSKHESCLQELKACQEEASVSFKASGEREAELFKTAVETETELRFKHESTLQELKAYTVDALESLKTEKKAGLKTAIEKQQELQSKYDLCLEELDSCKLELSDNEKIAKELSKKQLQTAIEKQQELQSKYDLCLEELDFCKLELSDKEEIMKELAKKQVEHEDDAEKCLSERRNKQALSLLADELNEAHIREAALEEMLSSCQKELSACQKKLESCENQVSEEQHGSEVCKDMISKLNKSNDGLKAKNKELKEETEALKESAAALEKEMDSLKQENEIARVVVGGNNADTITRNTTRSHRSLLSTNQEELERENIMMKDLIATSQLSVAEAKHMQKILSKQVEQATKRETKLLKEVLTLKARTQNMGRRLEEQELELDEFENDFALARNDARKVVEELRSQLSQLEKRNKQLEEASGGLTSIEDLKSKLRQLVHKNKRLEKEINACKARERRLESELGLEPRRCK